MSTRRLFLKQMALTGSLGAAGSVPLSAAAEYLRTSAPTGNGEFLTTDPGPGTRIFHPLEKLTVLSFKQGEIILFDGKNKPYFQRPIEKSLEVVLGGNLGHQLMILTDRKGEILDYLTFQLDTETGISDSSGKFERLLKNLYHTMTGEWGRESGVVRYNGKFYHTFVDWLRDHVHTLKGMKYFYPGLTSGIDLYAESQREDGMIWDNYNIRPAEGDYWEQRFDYGNFVKAVDEGMQEFRRIPVENDVEYLFIEGIYYTWKASGDTRWMISRLEQALKAIEYSTNDPYRWSEKYRLLKRGYTIDTWDFQNDEDAGISTGPGHFADAMVIKLPYTRFGVMFGDNTGMAVSCGYLAEMLRVAGREDEADRIEKTGNGIRERIDQLAWNGSFYRHHIPEDGSVVRDLGVDESKQVSLSNAYSLNRAINHDKAVSIIRTYQRIREEMPSTSPGEWYTIFPPFGSGFGEHNTIWSYMNGGVTSIVAGELAHGAFENGFEEYGVDILERILQLSAETGGYLHCTYRGAMNPAPERDFTPLLLDEIANADIHGDAPDGVIGWTMEGENDLHEFPAGEQEFHGIPFMISDPLSNGGRVCLGLSGDEPYEMEVSLNVGAEAGSVYFLHATNRSYYVGTISLEYSDGSRFVDPVGPGKIANWWYPSASQDPKQMPSMKVAWRGRNSMSRNVGVCLYGLNNPHPHKKLASVRFKSAGNSAKWMILGVTLSSQPVFLMPDKVSGGIPDNWGAAAVVYALVEGLCGVKDRGVAFDRLLLCPRWTSAGETNADVAVKYPASQGYVSYSYQMHSDHISLNFTGSQERTEIRLLLPPGIIPKRVLINEEEVEFGIDHVENSVYLTVNEVDSIVNHIVIGI